MQKLNSSLALKKENLNENQSQVLKSSILHKWVEPATFCALKIKYAMISFSFNIGTIV